MQVLKVTLSQEHMHQFLKSKLEKFSLNFSSSSANFKMAAITVENE